MAGILLRKTDQGVEALVWRIAEGAGGSGETELMDFQIPGRPEMEVGLKRLIGAGGKRLRPSLAWVCYRLGE